jgi:DNA invertase Pin-like site-specific DNA recombinase
MINDLETRGIAFESLSERIYTSLSSGKLTFHVFGSMAESAHGSMLKDPDIKVGGHR